jgi:hypothetical protein
MHRQLATLIATTCLALSTGSASADETPRAGVEAHPLFSGEHANKIREEIRLHEQRAKELEPCRWRSASATG